LGKARKLGENKRDTDDRLNLLDLTIHRWQADMMIEGVMVTLEEDMELLRRLQDSRNQCLRDRQLVGEWLPLQERCN